MLIVRGNDFDRAYVRDWLVRLLGPTDERISRWDGLVARV